MSLACPGVHRPTRCHPGHGYRKEITSPIFIGQDLRLAAALLAATTCVAQAQTLGGDFAADCSVSNLGSVPALPSNYGGLTFVDSDTVLIGGAANGAGGRLYAIDVTRGVANHVTGFTGSATLFRKGGIGTYNDGGVVFGPGGVLFTSLWPVNRLGQTKPGSTAEDKVIDPIASTRRVVLSGLSGAEGATIDPLTGDFLFSTFGGGSKIVVVSGFSVPVVPEPST